MKMKKYILYFIFQIKQKTKSIERVNKSEKDVVKIEAEKESKNRLHKIMLKYSDILNATTLHRLEYKRNNYENLLLRIRLLDSDLNKKLSISNYSEKVKTEMEINITKKKLDYIDDLNNNNIKSPIKYPNKRA